MRSAIITCDECGSELGWFEGSTLVHFEEGVHMVSGPPDRKSHGSGS